MEGPGVKVTVSFPLELFMALERASLEEDRPLANMVRYLVKRGLGSGHRTPARRHDA
ncbi:MAG: hypothetical protein EXR52_07755 [Dehalococcoidia bacterium]|nr:hypothetical protein [Dehalococcoidia bacterium]